MVNAEKRRRTAVPKATTSSGPLDPAPAETAAPVTSAASSNEPSLVAKVRYRFDLALSRGPLVVIGYLGDRLSRLGWGSWRIIIAAALLRGAYHAYQGFGSIIGNVAMGIVFGWCYRRWGRLMPLVVAHALIDTIVGYLEFVLATAERGRAAGLSPLELARETDLGEYGPWLDSERIVGNLHRAYADLGGGEVQVFDALRDMVEYNGGRPLSCYA